MIEIEIDPEDVPFLSDRLASADADGWRFPYDPDAFMRAAAANARIARRAQRRRRAEARAEALADVAAAQRAGLTVKSVIIEGTRLELGEPGKDATLTPLEQWKEKKRARSA